VCDFPEIHLPDFPNLADLFASLLALIPDLPTITLPGLPCPLD